MTDNVYLPAIAIDYPFKAEIIQVTGDYSPLIINMLEMVLETKAKIILETGTNIGDSARIWLKGLEKTGGELWTIDTRDYGDSWADGIPNIHFLKGSSLEVPWDKEIDILYLDSDHTYGHVMKELIRFAPFVKVGGAILMNDTLHHQYGWEVTQALRHYMLSTGIAHWTENVRGYGLGMVRVRNKILHYKLP